jgi:hypothetical protein
MLGTWDATNVVDAQVAVLTNVSMDHNEYAGPTLADIAREKSGIVKPGSAVVVGETDPDLVDIPIPGNDDSMRTIDIVIRELCDSVKKGKEGRSTSAGESPVGEGRDGGRGEGRGEGRGDGAPARRRSTRAKFRADESAPAAPVATEPSEGA